MKLEFKINKSYSLVHALKQRFDELPFLEWDNLQNKLWKEFPDAFYFFNPCPENIFLSKSPSEKIERAYKQFEPMVESGLKSKEFQRLYEETEKYLLFVKKQWENNEKETLKIIEELSRLTLPDKVFTVFITHPKLRNGTALAAYDAIAWGHHEDWENYSTVYLCHEIMHLLTIKETKKPKIMHVLIELIADDELRIRLNEKENRFPKDIGHFDLYQFIGHPELYQLKKKIIPYWKEYLKDNRKNIFDLEKEINI